MRTLFLCWIVFLCQGCYAAIAVSPMDEKRARDLVDKGVLLVREHKLDKADSAFHLAYELSGAKEALDGLGCVAFLRGEPAAAEKYYRLAIKIAPDYARAYGNLALLYESLGMKDSAEEMYRAALVRDPADFEARNNFAGYLFDSLEGGKRLLRARDELYKAQTLIKHPVIDANIKRVGGYE